GMSVPLLGAIDLLKSVVPDAKPPFIDAADAKPSEDIIETGGKSTVRLIIHAEQPGIAAFGKADKNRQAEWRALEDPWCMTCNGRSQIPCPARGCSRGTVRGSKTEIVATNTATGDPIYQNRPTRETCEVCGGRGVVDCPD